MKFNLNDIIRPNILSLAPYQCARDEFEGVASIYLDANENPYDNGLNRYPDPYQAELKSHIGRIKGVDSHQIFLGNGSDEAIDLLYRIFCRPGRDNYISISPSYGMYDVCGKVNDIERREAVLTADFQIDVPQIQNLWDENTKLIFLCSPNNPTGNTLNREDIITLCRSFNGIVVVDEAYIDFATTPSFTNEINHYPNLVVLQTFSKAWGLAGIRLGMAMAAENIIALFNKVKYPYNVNVLTQQKALDTLIHQADTVNLQIAEIVKERDKMSERLRSIPHVERVYPTEANFILVKIKEASRCYLQLLDEGTVVRNRSKVILCDDCLRVTIGTPEENKKFIEQLLAILD
ncbi:histidinol-phosphate transaminase [Halosquirtibacter xylanolyticus]|uniref:histidinol-phosphate transaminase n=1 Tax=Halosquirtibacter xylanolyticus TaxID=3374599 RepID=UPI003747EFBB|nr:histidinol-phosphate transaminase [Prolixibacteraceae bacterium]